MMSRSLSFVLLSVLLLFTIHCGNPRIGAEAVSQEKVQGGKDAGSQDSKPPRDVVTDETVRDEQVRRDKSREHSTQPDRRKEPLRPDQVKETGREPTTDRVTTPDVRTPEPQKDTAQPEPRPEPRPVPDTPTKRLSKGLQWVRKNPMFITGLIPSMAPPSPAVAKAYFQQFNATAVHLWEDGLGVQMDGWRKAGLGNIPFLSWIHFDGTSTSNKKLLGGYKANVPGRIGYQVGDEPHTMAALKQIEGGVKKARQIDPKGLIVVNFSYQAGKALDGMLHYYLKDMKGDIVSYDQYTRSQGAFEHLSRYRKFGLQYGVPYWRYIRAYLPTRGSKDEIHESDMRWDAFSGLTYGYTGHSHFLYQVNPIHKLLPAFFATAGSYTAAKTPLYAIAAKINKEMAHLGKAITQLTSTDVRYVAALLQPKFTQAWKQGAGNNPYITQIKPASTELFLDVLVGFFDDDKGEQYVMVQNMRHKHGSIPLNTSRAGTVQVTFDFSKVTSAQFNKTRVLVLNKSTGQVETKALRPLGGGKAMLEVRLAAGDPILFKYDSGMPFALQK